MIFAELQGKLGRDHSRAHERREDVLTSTTFGLLRYLPLSDWLFPLAQAIRPVYLDRPVLRPDANWLDVQEAVRWDVQLWQRKSPFGEPDVTVHLYDSQGVLLHLLVIEVKLYSPKSGSAELIGDALGEEGEELAGIDRDQLVRYWHFAQAMSRADSLKKDLEARPCPASLIYLTAHAAPPVDELLISLRAEPRMRLGWLSWFDVWRVVYAAARRNQSLPAQDLAALLEHKGFRQFVGFRAPSEFLPTLNRADAHYWRCRKWFSSRPLLPLGNARFWNRAGFP